jgi:hypothetical protein
MVLWQYKLMTAEQKEVYDSGSNRTLTFRTECINRDSSLKCRNVRSNLSYQECRRSSTSDFLCERSVVLHQKRVDFGIEDHLIIIWDKVYEFT